MNARKEHKISVRRPEEKISGRPTCKQNIKMNLKGTGWEDVNWIDDRDNL
jgi:hypothetical protein